MEHEPELKMYLLLNIGYSIAILVYKEGTVLRMPSSNMSDSDLSWSTIDNHNLL